VLVALAVSLSATCNPKHRPPDERSRTEAPPPPAHTPPVTSEPPPPLEPCDPALAAAGPLGPQVGPACEGDPPEADGALASELEERAEEVAPGQVAVGPARGGGVDGEGLAVGSVVLQGPPHCYTIVGVCDGDAEAVLAIASGRDDERTAEATLDVCPSSTASFVLSLTSTHDEEVACALGIYGD
jgi:hypothetical protein